MNAGLWTNGSASESSWLWGLGSSHLAVDDLACCKRSKVRLLQQPTSKQINLRVLKALQECGQYCCVKNKSRDLFLGDPHHQDAWLET